MKNFMTYLGNVILMTSPKWHHISFNRFARPHIGQITQIAIKSNPSNTLTNIVPPRTCGTEII